MRNSLSEKKVFELAEWWVEGALEIDRVGAKQSCRSNHFILNSALQISGIAGRSCEKLHPIDLEVDKLRLSALIGIGWFGCGVQSGQLRGNILDLLHSLGEARKPWTVSHQEQLGIQPYDFLICHGRDRRGRVIAHQQI